MARHAVQPVVSVSGDSVLALRRCVCACVNVLGRLTYLFSPEREVCPWVRVPKKRGFVFFLENRRFQSSKAKSVALRGYINDQCTRINLTFWCSLVWSVDFEVSPCQVYSLTCNPKSGSVERRFLDGLLGSAKILQSYQRKFQKSARIFVQVHGTQTHGLQPWPASH